MARRHRGDSNGSDGQPCHCQDCLKQNPDGVLVPHSILTEHRHRERLRTNLLARIDRSQSASSGKAKETAESNTDAHSLQPHPSEDPPLFSSVTSSISTEATDSWLGCIVSEVSMRLQTLCDCETHLVFINTPSPSLSFVFPDSASPVKVNTGDFALQTKKITNFRLLDAEARFCHLLQMIETLPVEQRSFGEVDVKEELLEALNKIHCIKERQWTLQAYPDGRQGSTVDNGLHFSQRRTTDATPTLLAALIMYIKNRSSTRSMRVNLALLRCILKGFAKKHGVESPAPVLIPKDIHTIVAHFNLDPTLHVSILCPRCYALYPLTEEALGKAEKAHQAHAPLPVCEERSSPDSPLCGATLWRSFKSGKHSLPLLAPIRKQVFQDLKSWIGRLLAIPGIEDIHL
ncbi:hypothetical protein F5878DRAFT_677542 [Lentinula raphanica]|uniref:Uncharacterized protein n=1 Tax=Lentinula raphanica TaxID=153919 RepID=A0AA38U9B6_9AGAR|nr:hypothetical protein F5878DRAFT_677542 [Lentinula raphanica]